jgi:dethiobiotin synthetase
MKKLRYFVTGTDTGVGKTFATCVLLEAARQQGLRTLALKPVAAGCDEIDGALRNDDALQLQQHMTESLDYEQINPFALRAAVAPHIAAQLEGRRLLVSRIAGLVRGSAMQPVDITLVEGAGGWYVPLNDKETLADLARELQLPVIMVVGMRLGCLNHAILTTRAIFRDGLRMAGWIANVIDPQMPELDANIATLKKPPVRPLSGCNTPLTRPGFCRTGFGCSD